jgi:RNA polymerase sigma factor (sigma-70 family)
VEILDETLLAGLGSGDPEAAVAFVRRFQGRVFGLAVTILHDPKAAEEVAQETFFRAWNHASAYDPRRGTVTTWLLTIARNLAIDALRVRRAQPVDPDVLFDLSDEAAGPPPDGDVADRLQLRGPLRRLPQEQRRALLLAAFFGHTAREIGEIDDVPVGTVKTRIRSAMTKLRAELGVKDDR